MNSRNVNSVICAAAAELVGTGATRTDVLVTSYDADQVRPLVVSNALAKVSGIKFRGGHSRWYAGIYPANCAWVYSGTVTNCVGSMGSYPMEGQERARSVNVRESGKSARATSWETLRWGHWASGFSGGVQP